MDTLALLNTTSHVSDTIFKFATYNWNKKNLIQLAVVSGIFIGTLAIVKYIDDKSKDGKKR
jgi:hypothetical protein